MNVVYMLGYARNHVVFLPSGAIVFRLMDELEYDIDRSSSSSVLGDTAVAWAINA